MIRCCRTGRRSPSAAPCRSSNWACGSRAKWAAASRASFFIPFAFISFSPRLTRRGTRESISRASSGGRVRLGDVFRHYLTFGACVLDRVFLLNDEIDQFDITIHGEDILRDIQQRGGGCILLGAHFGSFEVTRAVGRRERDVPISLLMYEENARKIRAALAAINPALETEVIGLGRLDSLIAVADRLSRGHFIGVLADRNVEGKDLVRYDFLGAPAAFPQGPFRVAMLLQRPVVLMIGVYRGGRRYEVFFESLVEGGGARPRDGERLARRCDAPLRRAARALLPRRSLQLVQLLRFLGVRCVPRAW